MKHQLSRKNFTKFILVFISCFIIALSSSGCGQKDKEQSQSGVKQTSFDLATYYPFQSKDVWSFKYSNIRGDIWRTSFVVQKRDSQTGIALVADSTEQNGIWKVYKSAYKWEKSGLTHLYRSEANGDCTAYVPPRLAYATKLKADQPYVSNYKNQRYDQRKNLKSSVDVSLTQRLLKQEAVTVGNIKYDDCVAIETVTNETFSDGRSANRRKVVWYANGIGPVKIVSAMPLDKNSLKGETVGELIP